MSFKNPSKKKLAPSEVRTIFKTGRRVLKDPVCDIVLAPSLQTSGRILVVTSARVGSAVERNRVRRRIKSLFYTHKMNAYGFDCIVIMKPYGIHSSYAQLHELITKGFKIQKNHALS